MEPPSSALTNALKIDNLSRIPYTIYAPAVSPGNNHDILPDSQPNIPYDDTLSVSASVYAQDTENLRNAERTLKAEGIPVLLNVQTSGLWVFHVYGVLGQSAETLEHGELPDDPPLVDGGKDERWRQMDKRLMEEWGLDEAVRDVILASSLTSSITLAAETAASERANSNPVTPATKEGPVTIDLTMDEDESGDEEEEEEEPYQIFIAAVLSVLSFHLSLKDGFTPLNTRTLVSPSSIPVSRELAYTYDEERDKAIGEPGTLPGVPVTAPEIVTPLVLELEAYMSSFGSLVITPRSEKQPAIRRLAACHYTDSTLKVREVFLAPWGEWGRLWVPPEDVDIASRAPAEFKWKTEVISYLQDRGIISTSSEDSSKSALQEAIEKGKWLHVEIWADPDGTETDANIRRVLWPETLLFIRSKEGDKTARLPPKEPNNSPITWESKTGGKRTINPQQWRAAIEHPDYTRLAYGKLKTLLNTLESDEESSKTSERDSGAEWWDIESAFSWAWDWFKGAGERAKIIEAEKKKQEAEAKAKLLAEQEKKQQEELEEKAKGKLGADLKVEAGSGVYPTPPDGAVTIIPGAGPTSTSSTGPTIDISSFPGGSGGNDMEMDWTGDGGHIEKKDNDSLHDAAMGVEADLFGEGMEAEYMGVTEDDFNFFDQPDIGFGDDDDGISGSEVALQPTNNSLDFSKQHSLQIMDLDGVDMNMGDVNSGTNMTTEMGDLQMETPGAPAHLSQTGTGDQKLLEAPEVKTGPENQVRTPPLSPHRAIRLLVPGYSPPETNGSNLTPPTSGSMKTPSTAPATVAAQPNNTTSSSKRRMSLYAPITFTETVEMADKKYAPGGRFFIPDSLKDKQEQNDGDATKPDKMPKVKRIKGSLATEASAADVPETHEVPEVPEVPDINPEPPAEDIVLDEEDIFGDCSDWEEYETESSDADDTTEYEESVGNGDKYCISPVAGMHAPLGFMSRPGQASRKQDNTGPSSIAMSDAAPQPKDETVQPEEDIEELAQPPWECMQPDPLSEALIGVFDDKFLTSDPITLGIFAEGEYQMVAALAAEQMAGWMNSVWNGRSETLAEEEENEETTIIKRRTGADQRLVEDTVKLVFKQDRVIRCNLETYAAIEDSIQEPPPLPPPPPLGSSHLHGVKPNINQRRNKEENANANRSWDIFLLGPPHVRLQRGDNILEMLPPALHFWETFGLAPVSGGKNVISFCLHPASGALEEGAEFLLQRVSASYEAGRFGAHVRGNLSGGMGDFVKNGLVRLEIPTDAARTYDICMSAVVGQMEEFGKFIAHGVADEGVNVVIYVINPFEHPSALVDISAGFLRMCNKYKISIATIAGAKPNNMVLQIVPANFVAHKLGLVMRVNVVHRLAVEVYTRCIQTDAGIAEAQTISAPPIQLARPLPKTIEFKLTADPSPALLKENQLLHITYAQSADERWVAASWSSSVGDLQQTRVLNLTNTRYTITSTPLRPFSDIINELWNTTKDLISRPALHWRVAITRLGPFMPPDESALWSQLASAHSRVSVLHLLAADLNPPLRVKELLPEVKMDSFWPSPSLATGASPLVSTPTPNASGNMVSPDASASTPGGPAAAIDPALDADADTELVDVTDECWGVILAHGRPLGIIDRARVSGVMLRKGNGSEGFTVTAALSLVSKVGGGKEKEKEKEKEVLREVMESWRGLGVLGSFQMGCGGVPWGVHWCRHAVGVARVL